MKPEVFGKYQSFTFSASKACYTYMFMNTAVPLGP